MAIGSVGSALLMARRGEPDPQALFIGAIGFSLLLFGRAVRLLAVLFPLLIVLGAFSILFGSSANIHLQT